MRRGFAAFTRASLAVSFALASLAVPFGWAPVARAEVVERVVAVVNDDAIFLSELRRRSAPYLERAMSAPSEAGRMAAIEELYRETLDRMVQEELFIQAADDMQVSVSSAEVDRAISNVQTQAGLSDTAFWQAVAQQGFSRTQYRSDVQRQLLRLKVLNRRARDRVNITEEQVRARYDMLVARTRRTAQFEAAHLFIEVPSGAGATQVREIRLRAEALRAEMTDEEAFWAAGGETLGTLSQGSLPQQLEDTLMSLDEGQLSDVVRGPSGFHIFLLEGRQAASSNLSPYQEVRMRIYRQMMEEAMQSQERLFVAELRRRAVVDVRL